MYVKMLDGPFTGQIRDLRNDVALEFLRDGRAGRAFDDPAAILVVRAQTPLAPPASRDDERPATSGKTRKVRA